MLDANLKAQLKAYLERVKLPFEITASLDDSAASREMHGLLTDIVALEAMADGIWPDNDHGAAPAPKLLPAHRAA